MWIWFGLRRKTRLGRGALQAQAPGPGFQEQELRVCPGRSRWPCFSLGAAAPLCCLEGTWLSSRACTLRAACSPCSGVRPQALPPFPLVGQCSRGRSRPAQRAVYLFVCILLFYTRFYSSCESCYMQPCGPVGTQRAVNGRWYCRQSLPPAQTTVNRVRAGSQGPAACSRTAVARVCFLSF